MTSFDTHNPRWDQLALASHRGILMAGAAMLILVAVIFSGMQRADGSDASSRKTFDAAGIEVSENARNYTVKIDGSSENALRIRMEGQTLHIVPKKAATGVRLEQNLALPEADPTQSPQVAQNGGQVVITVPKAATIASSRTGLFGKHHPLASANRTNSVDAWHQDVFGQFQRMQQQMDALFNRAMGGGFPAASSFPGLAGLGSQSDAGIDIQEKGNDYVVRAKVPEASLKNLDVAVDNDRILKITAQDKTSGQNQYEATNFTQICTLPGPVQSSKMKVENDGQNNVVITLPKA